MLLTQSTVLQLILLASELDSVWTLNNSFDELHPRNTHDSQLHSVVRKQRRAGFLPEGFNAVFAGPGQLADFAQRLNNGGHQQWLYYYTDQELNWNDADALCRKAEYGKLVWFDSDREFELVLRSLAYTTNRANLYWVGAPFYYRPRQYDMVEGDKYVCPADPRITKPPPTRTTTKRTTTKRTTTKRPHQKVNRPLITFRSLFEGGRSNYFEDGDELHQAVCKVPFIERKKRSHSKSKMCKCPC